MKTSLVCVLVLAAIGCNSEPIAHGPHVDGGAPDLATGGAPDLAAGGAPDLASGARPDLAMVPDAGCPQQGHACTTDKGCALGSIACPSGAPICVPDHNAADGTSCGSNAVCAAGQCVSCTAGVACNPTPCASGVTSCATGSSTCTQTSTSKDGTSCGADLVCSSGQCVACAAGGICAASQPCHTASISCASGAPRCVDSGNVANGSGCGSGMVCYGGSCVACSAGGDCQPPNDLCHKGILSCATGQSRCNATSDNAPDGTSCGSSSVCRAGSCVFCSAGGSCTGPSPCKQGVYSCASGSSQCVDGANKPDGTSCGTNQVCYQGSCGACTAGVACTPANACHVGATDCSSGQSQCKDSGSNVPNGASCGVDQYCRDGACASCVAGVACTPSDPCASGSTACANGQTVCLPTGSSGATSCGITTVGSCSAGACQCPSGSGLWNGDCAACPAAASSSAVYVNAAIGVDNQCCGRNQTSGFGGPCLTVTQALANIRAQKQTSVGIYLRGDGLGNVSSAEHYPLQLPAGVSLQAIVDTCIPGTLGQEVVHIDSTGGSVSLQPYYYLYSPVPTLMLGTNCAGVASGASAGLYVGPGAHVHAGQVHVSQTTSGVRIDGGELDVDAGTLSLTDVAGDGIVCQSSTDPTAGSLFFVGDGSGHGFVTSARVGGRALWASSGCDAGGNVTFGSARPCPSPKRDGEGIVADGDAYVDMSGAIQCMNGDGIALRANAALATNAPRVTFSSPCGQLSCSAATIYNSGCAGGYAEVGQLALKGVLLVHNHWGVHQKSSASSTDPAKALIRVGPGLGNVSASRFACSTSSEPGRCCQADSCPPGAGAFNESALVLYAESNQWPHTPVTLCTGCNASLQSCACSTGGSTPPDGIDVVTLAGGTTDISNYTQPTTPIACN